MRVAIDGRFLTQGVTGVQRYARELCSALDDALEQEATDPGSRPEVAGLRVTLLTPRLSTPPPSYRHLRVREVGRMSGHAWEQLDLPRHVRTADVLFCPGNVAPLATLRGRTPVVVTVHDLAFRYHPDTVSAPFRRLYELLIPRVLRRADRAITVSESERTRMLGEFPEAADRLVAVANGTREPAARTAPVPGDPQPPEGDYLLYVGALNQRKNVEGVVSAAQQLLRERPGLSVVFVGATADAFADVDLGPADPRVVLTGPVHDDAVLGEFYRRASVLLFPSFFESSGLPPVEAMAHGCPVVASEIPALLERCGDAAAYCDPHDVASIVSAAERVLDDAELAARLVERGYRRSRRYSWERCLEETLGVLREAAAGSSPGPRHPAA